MKGGARGCVGANGRVELTRVDDVIVFVYIFMDQSLQEEANSDNQIASSTFLGQNLFPIYFVLLVINTVNA